jgi:uncharacterized protein YlxP (DUF503 family)
MYVSSAKIVLDFYGNHNTKKKRDELERLIKSLRQKFNVSALEVEDFDDPERCVLGLSLVAANAVTAKSAIKKIVEYIDANSFARVVMEDAETSKFSYR